MVSHGLACLEDSQSKPVLQSMYPCTGKQMPASVTKGQAVYSMKKHSGAFLRRRGGVAPGTEQLRPEFLIAVTVIWEEDDEI